MFVQYVHDMWEGRGRIAVLLVYASVFSFGTTFLLSAVKLEGARLPWVAVLTPCWFSAISLIVAACFAPRIARGFQVLCAAFAVVSCCVAIPSFGTLTQIVRFTAFCIMGVAAVCLPCCSSGWLQH